MILLEKPAIPQTFYDGAQLNNFIASGESGRLFGCALSNTANQILISSGVLIIRGCRIKFDNEVLITFGAYPTINEVQQLVLRVVTTAEDSSVSVIVGSVDYKDPIDRQAGTYDYLLASYVLTPSGISDFSAKITSLTSKNMFRSVGENLSESELIAELPKLVDGIYTLETNAYGYEFLIVEGEQICRYNCLGRASIYNATGGNWVPATESSTVFIRYSEYADGTDFVDVFTGQEIFIGVAIGQVAPIDKAGYTWMQFVGPQGVPGAVAEVEQEVSDSVDKVASSAAVRAELDGKISTSAIKTVQSTDEDTVPCNKLLKESSFARIYSALTELTGITTSSTILDVCEAMIDNSILDCAVSSDYTNLLPSTLSACKLKIEKCSDDNIALYSTQKGTDDTQIYNYVGLVKLTDTSNKWSGWNEVGGGGSGNVCTLDTAQDVSSIKTFLSGATPRITDMPTEDLEVANKIFVDTETSKYWDMLLKGTYITAVSSFASNTTIKEISYGNGLFVAVANGGKLATSPNGIDWTQRTSSFDLMDIHGVSYNNGLWVAVGSNGKLATSTTGFSWTQRTSSFGTTDIKSVAYGNGLWVAVGWGGKLATSPNGIDWTQRTSSFGTTDIYGIAYGNNTWVATGPGGKIATSFNGIDWTQQIPGISGLNYVRYGNGIFVAAGSSGVLATSIYGTDWTAQNSLFGTSSIIYVGYNSGLFYIVGQAGKLAVSRDGITWTLSTISSLALYTAILANDMFVVGSSSGTILYSFQVLAGIDNKISYLSSLFDKVIKTQEDFDLLIASPTWLGVKSVAFFGKFIVTEDNPIIIPNNVLYIQGLNHAVINLSGSSASDMFFGYETTRVGYYFYRINGLEVSVINLGAGAGYGFKNCVNLSDIEGFGSTAAFYNCRNISRFKASCSSNGKAIYNCKNLSNFEVEVDMSTGSRAVSGCENISNCIIGSAYVAFENIDGASNCTYNGTGTMWAGSNYGIDAETCKQNRTIANNSALNS